MYTFNKQTLEFEKVSLISFWGKVGIVVISIATFFGFAITPRPTVTTLTQEEKVILVREYNEFSEQKLIEQIKALNFRFPHIILAQANLESGHFKSNIFLQNHNLFGMKEAKSRSTLAKGTNRGHAYYGDWQDSVVDYALFYSTYLYDIKTEGEYYEYLNQYYAEDPTYVQRLRSFVNKNNLKSKF